MNLKYIVLMALCFVAGLIDLAYLNLKVVPELYNNQVAESAPAVVNDKPVIAVAEDFSPPEKTDKTVKETGLDYSEKKTLPVNNGPEILNKIVIYFKTADFNVNQEQKTDIKSVLEGYHNEENLWIKIEGHADYSGSKPDNMFLSKKRADNVARYINSLNFSNNNIEQKSYGSTKPVNKSNTPVAWTENRRVEIIIIKGKS